MIKKAVKSNFIKFCMAFAASLIFAAACYDILLFFGISPFFKFYKSYCYHMIYPLQFMAIPCFVFSALAVLFLNKFNSISLSKQILLTLFIIALTVIISSMPGGMLWHFHDMRAGYFPSNWGWKIVRYGFREGMQIGWLIILLSVPYNIIGAFTAFFIMKTLSVFSKDGTEKRK